MERNTILAIVLSAVILVGGTMLTTYFNEKNAVDNPVSTERVETTEAVSTAESPVAEVINDATETSESDEPISLTDQNYPISSFVVETDLYRIEFNTAGGVINEILLLQEMDGDEPISMVLERDGNSGTLNLAFGGTDAKYRTEPFAHENISRRNEIIHRFYRNYIENGQIFTVSKTYRIIPGEYLIELIVRMETPDGKAVPLGSSTSDAYTLTYGPQIGPDFVKLDARNEIRENITWGPTGRNGSFKRSVQKGKNDFAQFGQTVKWGGVAGKYFGVLVSTDSGSTTFSWDNNAADGQDQPSRLQMTRPARTSAETEDIYQIYIGPLKKESLERYNDTTTNAFGVSDKAFDKAPRTSSMLGWLEAILRVLLEFFYKLIPNYGIAIILLTVLIKFILYPFTHNSYESTSKMQAVQPRIKALQAEYKEDPQKLNAKTAELYKEEGVNPMGGCLPMVFQMPVFFALYGLLNKYFPLRGATFIRGWIVDLSAPEFIGNEFANPLNLLFVDIPAIRILPILYLGGQLLMTKVTQQGSAGGQTGAQQKMLTLGMPIMFFFILYNMPSGLLLYWTSMNLITIGQQLATNWFKKRNAIGGVA